MNSMPCGECVNAMKCSQIVDRVFYSTSEGTIVSEVVRDMSSDHLSHNQSRYLDTGKENWHF